MPMLMYFDSRDGTKKETLQAFKPRRVPRDNQFCLGDYSVAAKLPDCMRSRVILCEKHKSTKTHAHKSLEKEKWRFAGFGHVEC